MVKVGQKAIDLMESEGFEERLSACEDEESARKLWVSEGVDIEEEFQADDKEELAEEDLDAVPGGISAETLLKLAVAAAKFGWNCGIILRAYIDAQKYGNPYRSYSKAAVNKAFASFGLSGL